MWKLKIAEGQGRPYLFSTNNFIGRQMWDYDPSSGTPEEHEAVDQARRQYKLNRKTLGYRCSADLLMRIQLKRASGLDLESIASVKVGESEEMRYEVATTAVRKSVRLQRAIQASDGHWPAEHTGPMLYTPPLIIVLYISGAMNKVLTSGHRKEIVRYIYNHQNDDGGWGFHIEGHSTMMGTSLNYVALDYWERNQTMETAPFQEHVAGFLIMEVPPGCPHGARSIFRYLGCVIGMDATQFPLNFGYSLHCCEVCNHVIGKRS